VGELAKALHGSLVDDDRIDAAFVFGSAARGTMRPASDLDVAVRYVDDAARASAHGGILELIGRLCRATQHDIHLVDLERASPELRRRVFSEGEVVIDRSPRRTRDDHVRALMEVMDWEYARKLRNRILDVQLARAEDRG
jgi:predicted nucleotidyltransferase